jgi:hypothetical protein
MDENVNFSILKFYVLGGCARSLETASGPYPKADVKWFPGSFLLAEQSEPSCPGECLFCEWFVVVL